MILAKHATGSQIRKGEKRHTGAFFGSRKKDGKREDLSVSGEKGGAGRRGGRNIQSGEGKWEGKESSRGRVRGKGGGRERNRGEGKLR